MTTLSDWIPFFRTNRRPNFGDVHTKYGTPDFELEYLWSTSLKDFQFRLIDTLSGQFEMLNVLITGYPGIGKTSFIYYLKHRFSQEDDGKYVLHIFHSNHARGHTTPQGVEERVQEEIREAWETLFEATGHALTYKQICGAGHPLRKTLNELSDYYKRNKKQFQKILIFAVDDVDLLENNELRQIIRYVISNMEMKSVKKWFFVRPQTYQNYDDQTKEFLQGFFPDVRQLPKTRLIDLLEHRLKAAANDGTYRIPFSPHLCNYIEEIVGGNLRRALSVAEKILCGISPPKENQNEEFIKNLVDRVAIKVLVTEKLLPDLHSPELRTMPYPLPLDIIQFLPFTADIAILNACVSDALRIRYSKARPNPVLRKSTLTPIRPVRAPYPREVDISFTLEKLQKNQLIEKIGSAIRLTNLGKVVSVFAGQPYFLQESIAAERDEYLHFDESYLNLAAVKVDHEDIARDYILRKF